MSDLWQSDAVARWQACLQAYKAAIAELGVEGLVELDR